METANKPRPTAERIIVTAAFPNGIDAWLKSDPVETIRDPHDTSRLAFVRWNNGVPAIFHEIERDSRIYLSSRKIGRQFENIVLPKGACPSGGVKQLASDFESVIRKSIDLDPVDPISVQRRTLHLVP